MRNPYPRSITWLVVLFLSAGAACLPAQTTTDTTTAPPSSSGASGDQTVQLSPFVVQAQSTSGYSSDDSLAGTRTNASIIDLATSITVLNNQLISDLGAYDVQHAVFLAAAGVTQNEWEGDDIMIRGFRAANGMLRDGIAQTEYTTTPMYDVERVEVVEGPVALVMGENSFIGGALNFVSRPATPTDHGEVALDWVTDPYGANWARFSANVSGPLYVSHDVTALYRITVGGTAGDGDHPQDDHNQRFIGGRLALYFHENKDVSLTIDWHSYRDYDQLYFDDFMIQSLTGKVPEVAILSPYSTATFQETTRPANVQQAIETFIRGTFLAKLDDYDNLRIFFAYDDYNFLEAQEYGTGFTGPGNTMMERGFVNYFEIDSEYVGQGDFIDTRSFFDGNFVNNFSAGFDLRQIRQPSAGNEYSNFPDISILGGNLSILSGDAALAAADNAVFPTQNLEYEYEDSFYLGDRASFWHDRLFVSAGMRWFRYRDTSQDLTQASGPVTETDFAPFQAENLGIVLKPVPWLSLYYNHVTTEIPLAGYGIPLIGPEFPLLPEIGKDNEVGVKLDYKISRNVSLHATWDHYYEAEANVRTPTTPGEFNNLTGLPVILQSSFETSNGWELNSGMRILSELADIDLILTAFREDTSSALSNFGNSYNAVGDTFSLMGKFAFRQGLKGLYIGGGGHQTGKKYQAEYILETPNLYSCFAGYAITKFWSVQFNWDDMTNKRYINDILDVASVEATPGAELSFETKFHW